MLHYPRNMFQFDYSFLSLLSSTWDAPKSLSISNSSFTHFLHDFHSIVELSQFGALISISNTTFTKISSCGAVLNSLDLIPVF